MLGGVAVPALVAPVAAAGLLLPVCGVRLVKVLAKALFFRLVTWDLLPGSVNLVLGGARGAGLAG